MDQEHQAHAQAESTDVDAQAPVAKPAGIGRRALLRGGAAAAPVLLTLHSGPVAATGTMSCTVASSFVSVATFASRNAGATTLQCSTLNAEHWHTQAKGCAAMAAATRPVWATAPLKTYLGRSCSTLSSLTGQADAYQVWQVMSQGSGPASSGELGVLHHILGLALSVDFGGSAVNTGGKVTTAYLAGIWQNYKSNGRYRPPAGGVDWSDVELISWLKMLQNPIPLPAA